MIDVEPHGKLLIVEPRKETKIGKIHLADTAKNTHQLGTILKVGPGVHGGYKKGDQVVWKKYDGAEVAIGLQNFLFIKEDSILGSWSETPDEPSPN